MEKENDFIPNDMVHRLGLQGWRFTEEWYFDGVIDHRIWLGPDGSKAYYVRGNMRPVSGLLRIRRPKGVNS